QNPTCKGSALVRDYLRLWSPRYARAPLIAETAALAAASTWVIPADSDGWSLDSTATSSSCPPRDIRPMLLITQVMALPSGSQPSFTAVPVPGAAAAVTPQSWLAATCCIRPSLKDRDPAERGEGLERD